MKISSKLCTGAGLALTIVAGPVVAAESAQAITHGSSLASAKRIVAEAIKNGWNSTLGVAPRR